MAMRGSVTVASLNVHWGHTVGGEPFDVVAACRALDAEIIALQEVWAAAGEPSCAARAAAALGYEALELGLIDPVDIAEYGVVTAERRASGWWGLAVLTKLPVLASATVEIDWVAGDKVPRAAQSVLVRVGGGWALRVVNAHLTNRPLASPIQLRRLERRLRDVPTHTTVVGDLNLAGPLVRTGSPRRRGVRGPTWPAGRPVVQLDHVLVSPDLAVQDGAVREAVGSDHLPVRARLSRA
jgi:endonuclease/exonuclease/phosphatase family metal-dependent hydrolase